LQLAWILETHIHADHLTASSYIKNKLGGKIAISEKITEVINLWAPIFNIADDVKADGSEFDKLFFDGEKFFLGSLEVTVLHTPGHTPTCVCYVIEDAMFVGDAIFMPDIGTARTDFPGGSAKIMYNSLQKILLFPDEMRIFTCHDYPPQTRELCYVSTIGEQKKYNILINEKIIEDEYVQIRNKRDEGKDPPKLLFPSIQVNIRAGRFGMAEKNAVSYIKIPVKF
jgi:glyoxylase-like metal-dependent hydrolase (beta-lactamase superfamily II)